MLGERVEFGLKLNDRLNGGPYIDVIVVGLRCGLKTAEYRPAIRVRTVNNDDLGVDTGGET